MKALKGSGPLLIAKDHMLAAFLPDAFDEDASGALKTYLTDVHALVFGGLLFNGDLVHNGMHLAVGMDRLAALFHDVDTSGWTLQPIKGSLEEAMPQVM